MTTGTAFVVGAGVVGLTTALCLTDAGFDVRVITDEDPGHTTSAAAGAVWAPYHVGGDPHRLDAWSRHSLATFQDLANEPGSGVHLITSMEVSNHPVAEPDWAPMVPGVRPCRPDEL